MQDLRIILATLAIETFLEFPHSTLFLVREATRTWKDRRSREMWSSTSWRTSSLKVRIQDTHVHVFCTQIVERALVKPVARCCTQCRNHIVCCTRVACRAGAGVLGRGDCAMGQRRRAVLTRLDQLQLDQHRYGRCARGLPQPESLSLLKR